MQTVKNDEEKIDVKENVETDMLNDEEFEAFVLANKERIKALLESQEEEFADIVKKKVKKGKKKVKKSVKNGKSKIEETAKGISAAALDPAVQKHFITMGIELMMGVEAFVKAIPKAGVVEDAYNSVSEMKANATKTYCEKNPDCQKKKSAPKKIELE